MKKYWKQSENNRQTRSFTLRDKSSHKSTLKMKFNTKQTNKNLLGLINLPFPILKKKFLWIQKTPRREIKSQTFTCYLQTTGVMLIATYPYLKMFTKKFRSFLFSLQQGTDTLMMLLMIIWSHDSQPDHRTETTAVGFLSDQLLFLLILPSITLFHTCCSFLSSKTTLCKFFLPCTTPCNHFTRFRLIHRNIMSSYRGRNLFLNTFDLLSLP